MLSEPGDTVLVSRSGQDRWLVMSCPCGCGAAIPINLDRRTGPAWRLYNAGPKITVYPSVWRESDCEAHFIISRGRVFTIAFESWYDDELLQGLIPKVESALGSMPQHYAEIADTLDEEPWDVLRVCRYLVERQRAKEGTDDLRSHFSRR